MKLNIICYPSILLILLRKNILSKPKAVFLITIIPILNYFLLRADRLMEMLESSINILIMLNCNIIPISRRGIFSF